MSETPDHDRSLGCPVCEGAGVKTVFAPNTNFRSVTWGECTACDGTGRVTPDSDSSPVADGNIDAAPPRTPQYTGPTGRVSSSTGPAVPGCGVVRVTPADNDSSLVSVNHDIIDRLEFEARMVVERGLVTNGQRIVLNGLLREAADEIAKLRRTVR